MTDTMSAPTLRLAPVTRPAEVIRASRPARGDDVAPTWMRVVGAVLAAGGAVLTAAVLGWPGDAPEVALLVPGLVALVGGLLLVVARAGLSVSATHVTLHFRPLPPRRIARRRIVAVRVVEADASTYGGLGLRMRRGVRALLLTPGTGVELTDDRGRVTFVRTARAESVRRALTA